jgi:hypothetical protein
MSGVPLVARHGRAAEAQEGTVLMTEDFHPPGQPPAEALANELADLEVVDGPNTGQVWTYEAGKGGYQLADPEGRAGDETVCTDVAAVIVHTGAEVVRPVEER